MKRSVLCTALALLLLAAPAVAQTTCTVTYNTAPTNSCTINSTLPITLAAAVSATVPSTLTLPSPTKADYDRLWTTPVPVTVTVSANRAWNLTVYAQTATWGTTTKPASDLHLDPSSSGPFLQAMPVGPANVTLASGSPTASTNQTIYYRAALAWDQDAPGTYQLTLVYTLAAP